MQPTFVGRRTPALEELRCNETGQLFHLVRHEAFWSAWHMDGSSPGGRLIGMAARSMLLNDIEAKAKAAIAEQG